MCFSISCPGVWQGREMQFPWDVSRERVPLTAPPPRTWIPRPAGITPLLPWSPQMDFTAAFPREVAPGLQNPSVLGTGIHYCSHSGCLARQLEICFCSLFNYADKSLGNAFIQICGRSRNGEIFVGKTPYLAVVHCKH